MSKAKKLFLNKNPVATAKGLLGMRLCRKIGSRVYKFEITETEAYGGANDRASHARHGRTERNSPMFGEAGTIYVYFTYGMHYMLNIVCGKTGCPGAVLIRSVRGISGPGRLTKKLKIDKNFNNKKLGRKTGLWLEKGAGKKLKIIKTPRVGVSYAGQIWSKKPYRFLIE